MINPVTVAIVYAAVATAVVPLVLRMFRAEFRFADVALAAVGAALLTFVPLAGGTLSLMALIALLNWRCSAPLAPDIVVAVFAARLAMVPALMLVR